MIHLLTRSCSDFSRRRATDILATPDLWRDHALYVHAILSKYVLHSLGVV